MNWKQNARKWLARTLNQPNLQFRASRMKGSTSSSIFLIETEENHFVLRVLDNAAWLAEEPHLARHEAEALREAERAGVLAPEIIGFTPEDVGFGAPVVLMSWLEGHVELKPNNLDDWLQKIARELAKIHRHDAGNYNWQYESWTKIEELAIPGWTSTPAIWQRAIEVVREPSPNFRPVFLHRDFHPTNLLWQGGEINGVVDWINACRGPENVDVAHCRTNLAQMFGVEIADRFLNFYQEYSDGFEYHPYWDVNSILDMNWPGPQFYEPWQEFGLERIEDGVLRQRMDEYLASVMARF